LRQVRFQEPIYCVLVLHQMWPTIEERAICMKQESYRKLVMLTAVTILLACFASLATVGAQVAQTLTSTTMATLNVTTTSTQYSFTTSTTLSTLTYGTQTAITYSTNTIQTTSTTTTLLTETPTPPTLTVTTTSTQSIQLLDNAFGELLVIACVAAAVMIAAPKLPMSMRRGIVCGKCGYQNPPFARSYCTKCGQALKGHN